MRSPAHIAVPETGRPLNSHADADRCKLCPFFRTSVLLRWYHPKKEIEASKGEKKEMIISAKSESRVYHMPGCRYAEMIRKKM